MSRRTVAIAAALSVLVLGSPLTSSCANPLADNLYNSGVVKQNEGDYQGAINFYDKAIEINPQYADAYSNRGLAKVYLKDYQGAIADCNKALEINPRYDSAYNNRGIAKRNLKDYQGAIADYTKAIEINPGYPDATTTWVLLSKTRAISRKP